MGLTLPIPNEQSTKDVQGSLTNLSATVIAEKTGRSSALSDLVLQSVHELPVGLNAIHIGNHGGDTNEYDGRSRSIINRGCISIDDIASDILIASMHVERGIGRLVGPF
jgi:hypothetical protein